jgi:tetratricopeptide (TPR) repeat protein
MLKSEVLAENDRFDAAAEALSEGMALAGGDLKAVDRCLDVFRRRGEIQMVDPVIEQLRGNRSNPDALFLAATWECERQRYQEALDLADRCLSDEPDNIDYRALRARALHGLGRKSEAYELFEENRQRNHNNLLNNLYHSHLLAADQIDLARASNIAREANSDAIGDHDVWMNLSYVYFQAGRYDLSRGEALKASRTFPYRPEPFFRIGMAMYMEGKPEAKETLQKAIALGLVGEELEQAKETLAKL